MQGPGSSARSPSPADRVMMRYAGCGTILPGNPRHQEQCCVSSISAVTATNGPQNSNSLL